MLAPVLLLVVSLLVLGESLVLTAVAVQAHRDRRLPDTFRCRLRRPQLRGSRSGTAPRSRLGWATWAHSVLLVRTGRLGRVHVLPVRFPEGGVRRIARESAKNLGPNPVMVLLRLDDGRLLEVSAPGEARELIAGPFLAACVLAPDR